MLRKDLRSQKKQLIAQNLELSDAEATKFWPIYDQYLAELTKINDKKYATIQPVPALSTMRRARLTAVDHATPGIQR